MAMTLVVLGCPGGRSGAGGALVEVGGAAGVDAGSNPRQHPASAEGEDGDAVWPEAVTSVEPLWLENCHHTGYHQGRVHDIVEVCMARQVAWISPARQIVVVQPVTHGPTTTRMGLLHGYAQPE